MLTRPTISDASGVGEPVPVNNRKLVGDEACSRVDIGADWCDRFIWRETVCGAGFQREALFFAVGVVVNVWSHQILGEC